MFFNDNLTRILSLASVSAISLPSIHQLRVQHLLNLVFTYVPPWTIIHQIKTIEIAIITFTAERHSKRFPNIKWFLYPMIDVWKRTKDFKTTNCSLRQPRLSLILIFTRKPLITEMRFTQQIFNAAIHYYDDDQSYNTILKTPSISPSPSIVHNLVSSPESYITDTISESPTPYGSHNLSYEISTKSKSSNSLS